MSDGLQGLKVVELSSGLSTAIAGKMLADLGARVLKIEPLGGDPLRWKGADAPSHLGEPSKTFTFLHNRKTCIQKDFNHTKHHEEMNAHVAGADLLIHDFNPKQLEAHHIYLTHFQAINPQLVILSITPFGLKGPYCNYEATDLQMIHGGGWGWIIPNHGKLDQPPLKPFGQHGLIQAGLHGCMLALSACTGAKQHQVGSHIDLSVQQVVMSMLGRHFATYPYNGKVPHRKQGPMYEPMSFYPCKDGHVFLICPEQDQFERLLQLIGDPDWGKDENMRSKEGRIKTSTIIKAHLSQWTQAHTQAEIFNLFQENKVGAGPTLNYPQILQQSHLQERGFFVPQADEVMNSTWSVPGAPYSLRKSWWLPPLPVKSHAASLQPTTALWEEPASPESVSSHAANSKMKRAKVNPAKPLQGVRVLDFSWVWAGPHCTALLAALGAEVVKLESSKRPDLSRRTPVYASGMENGLNRNGYFNQINLNKKSVEIDLGSKEGQALAKQLAAKADVVVSNFGFGVMEKFGLSPDELQQCNPELIIATVSAFGQSGPYRKYSGYGPLVPPLAGLSLQTGYEDDGLPQDVTTAYGDPNAGVYAAIGIAASLWAKAVHGSSGQVIDVSMWEAMLHTAFEGYMNHVEGNPAHKPMGNRSPDHAPHNVYQCQQDPDSWLAIAIQHSWQWDALCKVIDKPEWGESYKSFSARKTHEVQIDQAIQQWCLKQDGWGACHQLQAVGVPAFPSLSMAHLLDDPHLQAREAFVEWPHPEVGTRPLLGPAWCFLDAQQQPLPITGEAAPLLGADTEQVLQDWLGISPADTLK